MDFIKTNNFDESNWQNLITQLVNNQNTLIALQKKDQTEPWQGLEIMKPNVEDGEMKDGQAMLKHVIESLRVGFCNQVSIPVEETFLHYDDENGKLYLVLVRPIKRLAVFGFKMEGEKILLTLNGIENG